MVWIQSVSTMAESPTAQAGTGRPILNNSGHFHVVDTHLSLSPSIHPSIHPPTYLHIYLTSTAIYIYIDIKHNM